jgi:zinc/manganese transport system permease protein
MRSSATSITTMFDYDFMVNALAAGSIVAVVSGVSGYFLVLRGQAFAGHALSHVGFAGAAGAALLGVGTFWGLLAFAVAGAVGMGFLGERLAARDVAIGVVLSMALGLGFLFLHFYTGYAAQATALLFGNVLGVGRSTIWSLLVLGVGCVVALAVVARPLLFATLQPELAEARGVPLRLVSVTFLVIVAVAVAEAATIVGVLLVFALLVAPAATAMRLTSALRTGIVLSVVVAVIEVWCGLALAYATDWPTSFWITATGTAFYAATFAIGVAPRRISARRAENRS